MTLPESTFLVQRLLPPYKEDTNLTKLVEAFSFGGGLVNGGLSKEAMELLRPLFRFDYMGAAEFEFGAVPAALKRMAAEYKNYSSYTCVVDPKKLTYKPWACHELKVRTEPLTFYIYGPTEAQKDVCDVVWDLANNKLDLKELSYVPQVAFYEKPAEHGYGTYPLAWLELNNAFFFTTDEELCKKFADLMSS